MKIVKYIILLSNVFISMNAIAFKCSEYTEHYDTQTGKCITNCNNGYIWNPKTQTCQPESNNQGCPKGELYIPGKGCDKIEQCKKGFYRGSLNACIPLH